MREPWDLAAPYIQNLQQGARDATAAGDNALMKMILTQLSRQDAGTAQGYRMDELAQRNQYATQADTVAFDRQLQRDNTAYAYKDKQYERDRSDTLADRTDSRRNAREMAAYEGRIMAEREAAERGDINPFGPRRHGQQSGNDLALSTIRRFEGFRDKPYWDVTAHRVGYGSDTYTDASGRVHKVTPQTRVSRQDAERDLARRTREFQNRAIGQVGVDAWSSLSDGARAALTSVTYNYGSLPQSVVAAVKSGNPEVIARAIEARGSDNKGVNARRRAEEAALVRGNNSNTYTGEGRRYGSEQPQSNYADTVLFGEVPSRAASAAHQELRLSDTMESFLEQQGLEGVREVRMSEAQLDLLPRELRERLVPDPFYTPPNDKDRRGRYIETRPRAVQEPAMTGLPRPNTTQGPEVKLTMPSPRTVYRDGKRVHRMEDGREIVLPD